MTNKQHLIRPAMTALAAAIAFTATPAFAQEVTPQESPTTVEQATPAPEPTVTTTTTTTTTAPAEDPLAPDVAPIAATTSAPAKAKATARQAPRATATTRASAPARAVAPAAVATAAPAAPSIPPVEAPLAAAPPVPVEPAPVAEAAPVAAPAQAIAADDVLPIAGAAGLGLLALAGAGFALRRRKRNAEDEFAYDDVIAEEPVMARAPAPVVAAPTATSNDGMIFAGNAAARPASPIAKPMFGWGQTAPASAAPAAASVATASRTAGESHVDAAYRGPTPDNPFLSLKKRLRRAAFFDQRERAVAAGQAAPLPMSAGLPDALARAVRSVRPNPGTASAPTWNRQFQPA